MKKNNNNNILTWHAEKRIVSELIPNAKNPRKITAERLEKLKQQIIRQGFRNPPCVNGNDVLTGHQRLQVLRDLGLGDVEIDVMAPDKKLSVKEAKEIIATDNLSWGEHDSKMLLEEFYSFDELLDLGFTTKDIQIPIEETEIDDIPDVNIEGQIDNKLKYLVLDFNSNEDFETFSRYIGLKEKQKTLNFDTLKNFLRDFENEDSNS